MVSVTVSPVASTRTVHYLMLFKFRNQFHFILLAAFRLHKIHCCLLCAAYTTGAAMSTIVNTSMHS